jgi:hypothetical protein
LHWVVLTTQNAKHNAALQYYTPQARSPFWLPKPASEHAPERLLPRLSWSWTVLLPIDTHIKLVASIPAVLLPFVTYLVTLPPTYWTTKNFSQDNSCFGRVSNRGTLKLSLELSCSV